MAEQSQNPVGTETDNSFNIKHPTDAYRDAINSPSYRLSELMFGSLLAAYVLGFLSFASATTDTTVISATADITKDIIRNQEQVRQVLELLLIRLPYLFISVTYAYITAGAYVTYHGGILTMPFFQLEKLSFDFLLALSQAVFFGFSMLYPTTFPFWLGFTLIITAFRQYYGYKQVTSFVYDELSKKQSNEPTAKVDEQRRDEKRREVRNKHKKDLKNFRKEFRKTIKDYDRFSSWQPMPKAVLVAGIILLFFTPAIWWISSSLPGQNLAQDILLKNKVVFGVSLAIVILTVWYVHSVIGSRASFLSSESDQALPESNQAKPESDQKKPKVTHEIDKDFKRLVGELHSKI